MEWLGGAEGRRGEEGAEVSEPQAECSGSASKEREGPTGIKDGSKSIDQAIREAFKGSQCVVAKRENGGL